MRNPQSPLAFPSASLQSFWQVQCFLQRYNFLLARETSPQEHFPVGSKIRCQAKLRVFLLESSSLISDSFHHFRWLLNNWEIQALSLPFLQTCFMLLNKRFRWAVSGGSGRVWWNEIFHDKQNYEWEWLRFCAAKDVWNVSLVWNSEVYTICQVTLKCKLLQVLFLHVGEVKHHGISFSDWNAMGQWELVHSECKAGKHLD